MRCHGEVYGYFYVAPLVVVVVVVVVGADRRCRTRPASTAPRAISDDPTRRALDVAPRRDVREAVGADGCRACMWINNGFDLIFLTMTMTTTRCSSE
jgi:hypothetical protein